MTNRYERSVTNWFEFLLRASAHQLEPYYQRIEQLPSACQEALQMLLALADD